MQLQIRAYERADTQAMLSIYNWAVLNTTATYDYTELELGEFEAQIDTKIQGNYPILVAYFNNELLGYATLGQFRAKIGYRLTAENSVYVSAPFQAQGVGKALLTALVQAAYDTGFIQNIIAVIDAESVASIALHERLGFQTVGTFAQIGYKFNRRLAVKFLQLQLRADVF